MDDAASAAFQRWPSGLDEVFPQLRDFRQRQAVLEEVDHLDVHQRREVVARHLGLPARPVRLADVEQRLAQPLVGAGVGLRIVVVVAFA